MDIQQATNALYKGQMIKRRYWCNSHSIIYDFKQDKLIEPNGNNSNNLLTPQDLRATDWEISTSVAKRMHTYIQNLNITMDNISLNHLILQGTIVYTLDKSVPFEYPLSSIMTLYQFLEACNVKSINECNNILVFVEFIGDKILTINNFRIANESSR